MSINENNNVVSNSNTDLEPTDSNSIEQKRYFIVFYSANHIDGKGYINGYIDYTTDGHYLNKRLLIQQLEDKIKDGKNFIVKNIIELDSADFEMWTKELDKN